MPSSTIVIQAMKMWKMHCEAFCDCGKWNSFTGHSVDTYAKKGCCKCGSIPFDPTPAVICNKSGCGKWVCKGCAKDIIHQRKRQIKAENGH